MSSGYTITTAISALRQTLLRLFDCRMERGHALQRHYLDTLDWRLLQRGFYLQADGHDDSVSLQLHLYRLDNNQLVSKAVLHQLPRFCSDLPGGKLATLLAPLLKPRALVSQITVEVKQQLVEVVDKDQKIIAQLLLETVRPIGVGGRACATKTLWHIPIKGYDKTNRAISKQLIGLGELTPCNEPQLPTLILQLAIDTQRHTTPIMPPLEGAGRCDVAVKQLLQCFLGVMQNNTAGIVADIDSECLHDYRIAVRRSRTLLGQMPEVIPKQTLTRYSDHFARLGAITTPLRDLDVMLLNFDDYRRLLPAAMQPDLDTAFTLIETKQHAAQQQLATHLKSSAYQRWISGWQKYLTTPVSASTTLANAKRPLGEVADTRLWKLYTRALKQGHAITAQSPADELHTLRKSCKKLRYLIEFFQSLYPNKKIKRLVTVLKQLQDHLGEFQDLHVHGDFFRALHEEMRQLDPLDGGSDAALSTIIRQLALQQEQHLQQFHACFKTFASKEHQQWFKELFKP